MYRGLNETAPKGAALTASSYGPVAEPEVARAQILAALEACVRSGEARWVDAGHSRIRLADGSCWQFGKTDVTRLA